jgi:hypothetical protein
MAWLLRPPTSRGLYRSLWAMVAQQIKAKAGLEALKGRGDRHHFAARLDYVEFAAAG